MNEMDGAADSNGKSTERTTVNQPSSFQAAIRGNAVSDSTTSEAEGINLEAAPFRTTRSWTFSSGNRRQHQFAAAIEPPDPTFDDGFTWTPPPPNRSTSPHPLGYHSDSAPPLARSASPCGGSGSGSSLMCRSASGAKSPLLQWKMAAALQDLDDPAVPSAGHLSHRSSIGGAAIGGNRRFSISVHHPHSMMPLAQQIHHSHLLAQHHQQSSHSLFPPAIACGQRRRGSAAAYSLLPSCTIWDTPPSGGGGGSNLNRLRRLGHSCPQLNSLSGSSTSHNAAPGTGGGHYRSGAGPVVKLRRDIAVQRRHSNRMSRRSFNANTSPISSGTTSAGGTPPVCHCGRSPLRNASPNLGVEQQQQSGTGRPCLRHAYSNQATSAAPPPRRNSLRVQCHDARRWSVTSLPSSGYGTPGSSAVSSQYSSQERLAAALEEQCYRYDSNESNPACDQNYRYENPSQMRLRSRSLSSIAWLNLSSSRLENSLKIGEENVEVALRNNVYKERFPKAKRQMEEKLETFLAENSLISSSEAATEPSGHVTVGSSSGTANAATAATYSAEANALRSSGSGSSYSLTVPGAPSPRRTSLTPPVVATDAESLKLLSDGSARFLHLQIMELAMDCLQRSKNDSLSSAYFCEFSQNLEELLEEAKEKAAQEAVEQLSRLVKDLLLIVSRSARLLECLEFDPEEFYRVLHEAEGHAQRHGIGVDLPQYIIRQLGLNRGPLDDLHNCLTQADSGHSADTPSTTASPLASSIGQQPAVVSKAQSASSPTVSRRCQLPKESDFDIIKLVSNGAYGAVFLVRHKETRRRFALKKLSKSNLMLRNQIDQVYAERDILTFTDNPFVVSFYGSFETKRHLCMVMEYVEGGDCGTLLKNIGVMPVEMARLYIAETILAIEYLHSYGIVHRDLKPDNLLITAMGHIKLTDFGLSKIGLMNRTNLMYEGYFDALMSETTQFQDRQICGTPEYIAPEVILRQGYGKPVDWWALGIILYEFLVGTVPFFGDTPEQLFSHVINDEIEWPEEPYAPPEDAQDLANALLQQNPLQRLGTVNGAIELKEHRFFISLDWNSLLRQKAEFIPQLEGEDDTSYFDTRADRYQHDLDSGDDDQKSNEIASTAAVWPVTKGSPFASFSSSSPRYILLAEERNQRSVDSSLGSLDRSEMSNVTAASADGVAGSVRRATDCPAAQSNITRPNLTFSQSDDDHAKLLSSDGKPTKHVASTAATPAVASQQELRPAENTEVKWRRKSDVGPASKKQHLSPSIDAPCPLRIEHKTDKEAGTTTTATANPVTRPRPPARSADPPPNPAHGQFGHGSPPKLVPLSKLTCINSQQSQSSATTSAAGKHATPQSTTGAAQLHKHSDSLLTVPTDSAAAASSSTTAAPSMSPTCSSATSSRDPSPTRSASVRRRSSTLVAAGSKADIAPIINKLKPPVVIRRGIRGFGFTIRAIRVYLGDTDYYTIQHLVVAVESGSPSCDAGLRPNDLLTHINGESVKNLTHTEVVQRLMTGGDTLTLRVSPLESTTIRQGGPARKSAGKLVKRKPGAKHKYQKRQAEKSERRRSSILRRLSGKRGSFEATGAGVSGAGAVGGSGAEAPRQLETTATANLTQLAALQRSVSNSDGTLLNPPVMKLGAGNQGLPPRRIAATGPGASCRAGSNSSRSNGSSSSIEIISPANDGAVCEEAMMSAGSASSSSSSRPSSFFGLKNKVVQTLCPRRQMSETIQLSPLVRSEAGSIVGVTESTAGVIAAASTMTSTTHPSSAASSMKPSAHLVPIVQKKQMAKSKNSDSSAISTSTCSELSSSSTQGDLPQQSQVSRSRRNFASIFDSSGSTASGASAKSRSSVGK